MCPEFFILCEYFSAVEKLTQQIEAILFSAQEPVSVAELADFFTKQNGMEFPLEEMERLLEVCCERYADGSFAFELVHSGGGYQFRSKAEHHDVIAAFLQRDTVKRLTGAALETLAIIAYKQPVTKSEMEIIRGVSCDYTIQKLMERELVEIKGRSSEVGRPLLYGTSEFFLDYFGINSVDELPKLKEFAEPENQIGEKESINQN
jgi:segregation and condensation protein B